MSNLSHNKMRVAILAMLMVFLVGNVAYGQPAYKIEIKNIDRVIYKNFLGIPKTVDYTLFWDVSKMNNGQWFPARIDELSSYEVLYAEEDSSFSQARSIRVGVVDSCKIADLKVGKKYFFKVQALAPNGQLYQSQVVWMLSGKPVSYAATAREEGETSWIWYFPLNGRFPLTLLGYGEVFDKSTVLGKMAFHVIWWFFLFGVLIWYYCIRHLALGRIFPMERITFRTTITPFNYEAEFNHRKSPQFFGEGGIIQKWKNIIEETAKLLEKPPKMDGDSSLDVDKLRITVATWWRDHGRIEIRKLLAEIKPYSGKYPTARIIQAGLANHEINGFKFLAASEEVDRAIENRAMMELEHLKGKSKLEWLWNLGATAPLIGLFGTVTGIYVAFRKLALQSEQGIVETSAKISELAGGINEALWTTIFGLSVGILLVILYYVYKNKLDWIYGKWEEIYVDVSEKL